MSSHKIPAKDWPKPNPNCDCRTCDSNRIIREQIRIYEMLGLPVNVSEAKVTLCMTCNPEFKEYLAWVFAGEK